MECRELDNLLYPYLDGELVEGDRTRFEAHLATCEGCRKTADKEHAMLLHIRSRAKEATASAPDALRARLSAQLQGETRRSRVATWSKLTAAAAGIAVASVAAHHGYRSFQRHLYVEDAASRHARAYPMEVQRPTPEQLEAWFDGKLDYPVKVPHFQNAVSKGGRLLNVRASQAAVLEFASAENKKLTVFVYGDKAGDVDVDGTEVSNSNGYNVATWRDGDVVYQLVTDLDEQDIRQMLPQAQQPGVRMLPPQVQPAGPTIQPAAFHP